MRAAARKTRGDCLTPVADARVMDPARSKPGRTGMRMQTTGGRSAQRTRGRLLGRVVVAATLAPLSAIAVLLAWGAPVSASPLPSAPSSVSPSGSSTAPSTTHPCSVGAPGLGFFNGAVCIGTTQLPDGRFQMTDPARPNLSCGSLQQDPLEPFTQSSDSWGNGQPADLTTACVDAMYAASEMWNMLGDWLGRTGMDGQGHAAFIGVGYHLAEARFRPGGPLVQIGPVPAPTSGSGLDPEEPAPTTALDPQGRQYSSMDIVAHEFGHMVFLTTPGGTDSAEAGPLDEGTGDIMAQLTVAFAGNPKVPLTYTMGSQIGPPLIRIMYQPSLCGPTSTICPDDVVHPDCYSPEIFTTPNLGEHAAAGPLNHWFYLLAEGSNPAGFPPSPTCDGSTLTGLGIKAAGQIWYQALLLKTPTWTYRDARSATLAAAKQLFPGGCTVFDRVKAAWNAVSVPALPDEPTCGAPTPTPAPAATPTPVPTPIPAQPGAFPSQPGLPKTGARPFQAHP